MGVVRSLPALLLPPTSREDLRLHSHLKYPHGAKAPYTCEHPCFLRDPNPGPTAPQSASLTTIPDGRPVEGKGQVHHFKLCSGNRTLPETSLLPPTGREQAPLATGNTSTATRGR
ncbi:hypothetical protein TNCV_2817201 [Trichonephila clavipes]|nr:hypothetical protein TNCV_2817201 [Trichonephila clavipes]